MGTATTEQQQLWGRMRVEITRVAHVCCTRCGAVGPESAHCDSAREARLQAERLSRHEGWLGRRSGETLCPKCRAKGVE